MPTPAIIQYPTRTPPDVRGRKGRRPQGRWATIKLMRIDGDDFEEIINISAMIPGARPPELPGLDGIPTSLSYRYFLEIVPVGVKVGMIRNGTVDPVGGWGFPGTFDYLNLELREDGTFALREDFSIALRQGAID